MKTGYPTCIILGLFIGVVTMVFIYEYGNPIKNLIAQNSALVKIHNECSQELRKFRINEIELEELDG